MPKKLAPPNYTQTPNTFFDDWLPQMELLSEIKVVGIVLRETFGWHKEKVKLSFTDLETLTGLSRPSVSEGVQAAIEHGYIAREKDGQGYLYYAEVDAEITGKDSLPVDNSAGKATQPDTGKASQPVTGKDALPSPIKKERSKKLEKEIPARARALETKRQIEAAVNRIFKRWQERFRDVLDTGQYKLTPGVQKMIGDRLRSKKCQWTEDNCYEGIEGLRLSRYHMGDNSDHKKYLSPKYVFEDDDKLQRFVLEYRAWLKDREAEDEATERIGCRFCGGRGFVVEPFKLPSDATPIESEKWDQVMAGFKSAVSQESFETWFSQLSPIGVNCTRIYLRVPTIAVRDWLSGQYRELLGAGLTFGFGPEIEVQWVVGEGLVPCTADVHKRGN